MEFLWMLIAGVILAFAGSWLGRRALRLTSVEVTPIRKVLFESGAILLIGLAAAGIFYLAK